MMRIILFATLVGISWKMKMMYKCPSCQEPLCPNRACDQFFNKDNQNLEKAIKNNNIIAEEKKSQKEKNNISMINWAGGK
jgi:ribosomal protein L32